jgi:hypothetical protein
LKASDHEHERRYWVVSPALNGDNKPVQEWADASIRWHAAFMGYRPNDANYKGIGRRFAKEISADDVILIARRHSHKPEVVGFGVVHDDKYKPPKVGLETPHQPNAWRVLKPFIAQNRSLPASVPFMGALKHTMALARLHAENDEHRRVCEWMWQQLSRKSKRDSMGLPWIKRGDPDSKDNQSARESPFRRNQQLDYKFWTRKRRKCAIRKEEQLIESYENHIAKKGNGHSLVTYNFQGNLRCDAVEKKRDNLIEAKSDSKREYVRMAVGQLLDYEFQRRAKMNKAILVPNKPSADIERWLQSLKISLIWPEKRIFCDNAGGKFT